MDDILTTLQNRLNSTSVVKIIPYNDTFTMTVYSDGLLKFEDDIEYFFIDNGLLLKVFNKNEEKEKELKGTKNEMRSSANTITTEDLLKVFTSLFNNKAMSDQSFGQQEDRKKQDEAFVPNRDFSPPLKDIKTSLDFMDKK